MYFYSKRYFQGQMKHLVILDTVTLNGKLSETRQQALSSFSLLPFTLSLNYSTVYWDIESRIHKEKKAELDTGLETLEH